MESANRKVKCLDVSLLHRAHAFTTKRFCGSDDQRELATCGFSIPMQSNALCVTWNPNSLVPPSLPSGSPPSFEY